MVTTLVIEDRTRWACCTPIITPGQGGISTGRPDRGPDARISKEAGTLLGVDGDGGNDTYLTPSRGEDGVWLMEDCDDLCDREVNR